MYPIAMMLAALASVLAIRVLSSPRWRIPDAMRLALGMLILYAAVLVALWVECKPWQLLSIALIAVIGSSAMQGDGLARVTDAFGRARLPLYLLSTGTVAALILLFVPITTYLTSPGELDVHLEYLLTVHARDTMLVVYLAAGVYMIAFTPRMRTLLTLLAVSTLGLVIVYTYVVPFGYPALSGLTFEHFPLPRSSLLLRALFDAVMVMAIAPVICWALFRWGVRPLVIGIALIGVSLVVMIAIRVSEERLEQSGATQTATMAQPLRFSKTHPNVLVVFLDRFMGSFVERILRDEPELAHQLAGFTWYPRTLAAGYNSIAGVHPMLGGYDYTPLEMNARHQALSELSVEAFSILPYNFAKHGYQVNIVGPRGMGFTMEGDCSLLRIQGVTCTPVPISVVRTRAEQLGFDINELAMANYTDLLVLLGSMRSVPYMLKAVLYEKGPWRPFLDSSAATTFKEWAQLQALAELSRTDGTEANFNYISNLLPHQPRFMGADCQPRHETFDPSHEELQRIAGNDLHVNLHTVQHYIAARCSLVAVANYLDFLKSAGVYNNTKIVIVSDHGIAGLVQDYSTRAVAGGTTANKYVGSRSVLLVKERNANGPLRISETFAPNAEVPRILCEEIAGCVNPYLNDKPLAAAGRDDPFYVSIVPWQFSAQKREAFVIETQYVVRGKDPFDARNWSTLE